MEKLSKITSSIALGGALLACNPQEKVFELPTHPVAIQATITNTHNEVVAILCRDKTGTITRADGFEKFPITTEGRLSSRGHFIAPSSGLNYDKNHKGTNLKPGEKVIILEGSRMIYDSRLFQSSPEYKYLEFVTKDGVVMRHLSPTNTSQSFVITEQIISKMNNLLQSCSTIPVKSTATPEFFRIDTK